MTRRSDCFVFFLTLLLLGSSLAFGQDSVGAKPKKPRTPEDYKPRTLKELSASAKEAAAPGTEAQSSNEKEERVKVRAEILPSRVRVSYTGLSRPLPIVKRDVLLQWARLYAGSIESYSEPYESEMLFDENGVGYWLAVRKQSLPDFKRELKRGDEVDLHLIRVGAAKVSEQWESMLLVESFQKSK